MRLWEAELGEEPAAGLTWLLVRDPGTRGRREQGLEGTGDSLGAGAEICSPASLALQQNHAQPQRDRAQHGTGGPAHCPQRSAQP